ncbi:MAG TPA: DUF4810 domain-containing protein [Acidobacteriota bacterium]|nr:DUF4810 domain-containing protein [Acidobacteriota bacterium]
MNRRTLVVAAAVLAPAFFAGCQTARPLYYWGNYEGSLYQAYSHPEKMPAEEQIAKLQEDLTKAAAAGLKTNPGLHAQLGYAYLHVGKPEEARKEFETEKVLFPESAVLMDRLIQKLSPAPQS